MSAFLLRVVAAVAALALLAPALASAETFRAGERASFDVTTSSGFTYRASLRVPKRVTVSYDTKQRGLEVNVKYPDRTCRSAVYTDMFLSSTSFKRALTVPPDGSKAATAGGKARGTARWVTFPRKKAGTGVPTYIVSPDLRTGSGGLKTFYGLQLLEGCLTTKQTRAIASSVRLTLVTAKGK